MPPTTKFTSLVPSTVVTWIEEGPDDAIHALLNPVVRREVLDVVVRAGIKRASVEARPVGLDEDAQLRVRTSIHWADLNCRKATGRPLRTVRDYMHHRIAGSPGLRMIYSAYGSWHRALLAAQDAEHAAFAKRRARGGDRRTLQFSLADGERALLEYAELHAGVFPEESDWLRWINGRPEMPSVSQIRRRTGKRAERTWKEACEAAAERALREARWPVTRARLELSGGAS